MNTVDKPKVAMYGIAQETTSTYIDNQQNPSQQQFVTKLEEIRQEFMLLWSDIAGGSQNI